MRFEIGLMTGGGFFKFGDASLCPTGLNVYSFWQVVQYELTCQAPCSDTLEGKNKLHADNIQPKTTYIVDIYDIWFY